MPATNEKSRTITMKITIDTAAFTAEMKLRLSSVVDPKRELFREVVTDLIPIIHERIHVEGRAGDGSKIGTYSNAYMAVRTGNYKNSDKITKGKNAGKNKNAGTSTKGTSKGSARNKYNRTGDTKVILSLTRQMENDYAVVGIENGWGIGFTNEHNADKARWNDERYGKKVFTPTEEELDFAIKRTKEIVAKAITT